MSLTATMIFGNTRFEEKIKPRLKELGFPLDSYTEVYRTWYADGFSLVTAYDNGLVINISKKVFGEVFSNQVQLTDFTILSPQFTKEYAWDLVNKMYAQLGKMIEEKRIYLYEKGELSN